LGTQVLLVTLAQEREVGESLMAVRDRNAMVVRLKDELQATIDIVAHTRESLERELGDQTDRWSKLGASKEFIARLKDLTSSFNSLTEAKIRLDKAEKQLEEDMTPEEEYQVVLQYLVDMDPEPYKVGMKSVRKRRNTRLGRDIAGRSEMDEVGPDADADATE